MDGVDLGDAATWAGVVVSIAVAGLAWRQAWRSKGEARASQEHAERSAAAAERSAAAVEQQVMLAKTAADAARNRPPWRLEQVGDSKYHLVHERGDTAYDLSIEASFVYHSPVLAQRVNPNGGR